MISFVVAAALAALNVYQYVSQNSARRSELEQTLLRPTPKAKSGQALDPALKEIPYAAQVTHPRGVTTEEAERIVSGVAEGRPEDWMILDIRESAETEMGSLPGSLKVRFPDIPQTKIDFAGKRSLLICHNGNRSAETCEALAKLGIDCRFIVGGLEKWLAEGRSLAGFGARTIDDLRAIPDYPRHEVLLETGEVQRLVKDEEAIFVDVRYPGEFDVNHLPGALNLPLRPTPSAEIERLVAALPARPVIAPCYDRRSCFFAEILGLTLTRANRDFRGRYTLPWEYFVPSPKPPHVEKLLIEANKSTLTRMSGAIADVLEKVARHTGLPVALLLLALLSRLIVLPFSLKAERDQIAARAIKPVADDYKARFGGDSARYARAMRGLYKRHGLTPGRNLIALAFLPVLALAVEAATAVAGHAPERMLWIPDLAGADPMNVLPTLFALLIGTYLTIAFAPARKHVVVIWGLAAPLLFTAAYLLPAAASVYITASAGLLLLQRFAIAGVPGWSKVKTRFAEWRRARRNARLLHPGLIDLSVRGRLVKAGNKALRLAELKCIGLPVPEGLVLSAAFLADYARAAPRTRADFITRIWRHIGAREVAVRSSAEGEDGAALSYAGVFESVLNVKREGLGAAIDEVQASFSAARATHYTDRAGAGAGNILIQPMLAPDYAGVLFTEDPANPGVMLIELVEGTGDKLVSGRAAPDVVRLGRMSGRIEAGAAAKIDLEPLRKIALEAEEHYGRPQDIEWAHAGGRFVVLQCRDITSAPHGAEGIKRNERRRLLARAGAGPIDGAVFAQTEMSELLPRPTPASLSLLTEIWSSGGSVDLALRSLGFQSAIDEDGPPLHLTVFGRLYTDKRIEDAQKPRLSRLAGLRLDRALTKLEADFRGRFLPSFLDDIRLASAIDYTKLAPGDLIAALERRRRTFVDVTYAEVCRVNIAAQAANDIARAALTKKGFDPARHLSQIPMTELETALIAYETSPDIRRSRPLHDLLGHRANVDYELSEPRYGENPGTLEPRAARLAGTISRHRPFGPLTLPPLPLSLAPVVVRARRLQTLKEDAKHHALREYALLRTILLAIGDRYGLDDTIFHLTLTEIAALPRATHAMSRSIAARRAAEAAVLREVPPLGNELSIADLEGLRDKTETADAGVALKGTRVSGTTVVTGRALVVSARAAEDGAPIADFRDGDILIAPMIHQSWLAEVVRAGGVVSTIGGWLSHMAIVAREHGIAMVTGVTGLDAIATGMNVRLHPDGTIEIADSVVVPMRQTSTAH